MQADKLMYPNPYLSIVQYSPGSCVMEEHSIYYNDTLIVPLKNVSTDTYGQCCAQCKEHHVFATERGQAGCTLWT